VLVNSTSYGPVDDALGLGVVPQQIALVVGSSFIAFYLRSLDSGAGISFAPGMAWEAVL
jgi:hypothetical protein